MLIKNKPIGCFPLLVHAQGTVHKDEKWEQVSKAVINDTTNIAVPENLTIVTFASEGFDNPLEKQLQKAGISYLNPAATIPSEQWKNTNKIELLASLDIPTEYVLILDSLDILLSEDITSIISRFIVQDTDILFGASINIHPPIVVTKDFRSLGKFKHLNAGSVMGYTDKIKEFYKATETDLPLELSTSPKWNATEQLRIKCKLRDGDFKSKIDNTCQIFQTLGGTRYEYNNNLITIDYAI